MFTILSLSYDEREIQPKSIELGVSFGWAKIALKEANSQLKVVRVVPTCVLTDLYDFDSYFDSMKKDAPRG